MSRATMQQALEALELGRDYAEGERLENERRYRGHEHLAPDDAYALGQIDAAITALRAALAEQDRGSGWCPIHQHYKPCAHNTAAQAQPLTIERLRAALVASRVIDLGAVEDPDNYDDGVMLARIEALYRRLG